MYVKKTIKKIRNILFLKHLTPAGLKAADECSPCTAGQYCEGGKEAPDGDCLEK